MFMSVPMCVHMSVYYKTTKRALDSISLLYLQLAKLV